MLASQGWPLHVMDDQGSIERLPEDQEQQRLQALRPSASKDPNAELVRLNRACVRRFVNVFFALYRALHLWEAREPVRAADSGFDCGIRLHHIVAASDDFSRLSMHWDLMPAAKLNYVHDFSGFFNCISQVLPAPVRAQLCCCSL